MDPVLLLANAEAGGDQTEALETAVDILREATDVEVCKTSNPGELDGVLQRAGSRSLVVAGGDGSLHAVIAALHRRHELDRHPIGLIPLGTGNDFARTVGIPLDPAEAAEQLIDSVPRATDLIVDELGGVVVNNVHAGAGALASRKAVSWKERLGPFGLGIVGYPIGAAMATLNPPHVRLRIEADGKVVADMDRQVLMVAVGNGASVGGGTDLNPEADPRDGKLDLMVSFSTDLVARAGYALHLLRGRHEQRDDVVALRASQVTISGEDFWLSADGEISGPETRRSWHIEPGAYNLLLP